MPTYFRRLSFAHTGPWLAGSLVLASACGGRSDLDSFDIEVGGTTSSSGGVTSTGSAHSTGGGKSTGGVKSTGGRAATGGNWATGGIRATGGRSASGGAATGGKSQTGGTQPTGGKSQTGGTQASGGLTSTGGKSQTGGSSSLGGISGTGGYTSSGGGTGTGGAKATGGTVATGGFSSIGGATSSGGNPGSGGSSASGGTTSTGGNSATGGASALSSIERNCMVICAMVGSSPSATCDGITTPWADCVQNCKLYEQTDIVGSTPALVAKYDAMLTCSVQNLASPANYVCASWAVLNMWTYAANATACDSQVCSFTCDDMIYGPSVADNYLCRSAGGRCACC